MRRRTQARLRSRVRSNLEGWAFISPTVLGLLIFTAFPMVASLYFSFSEYDLLTPPRWVGLKNFMRMSRDNLFYTSLGNTAYYTFIGVPAQTLVALLQAFLLNMKVRGINVFRTLYYLPTVTPTVATVILWVYILNRDYGLVNSVLWILGIPSVDWLFNPRVVKLSFIIMSLWQVGGRMVVFLAALQGVPQELYESASIDGANSLRRAWHITLPMISPVIFFNLIIGIIGAWQVFTVAFIATDGGPANATLFYVLHLYRHAFENLRMGYASALAWILFLVVMAFTALQFLLSRRWVYYEAI
ncbi:MAG: carbohydrate ABC transporter permease [Anaerolineae bacterium]